MRLRELAAVKDIKEATSDQIIMWAQRLDVHRVQREVLNHIREDHEFDSFRWNEYGSDNARQNMSGGITNSKYCGTGYPRDSVQHMAKCLAVVAKPTNSRQYAHQCRVSSKATSYVRVAGQCMRSIKIRNPVQYSENKMTKSENIMTDSKTG